MHTALIRRLTHTSGMRRTLLGHRFAHTNVRIGDCHVRVKPPTSVHLVPASQRTYCPQPTAVAQLRWMAQKELLQQDCLLTGPPGSQRRNLALRWASLARREIEYLALSSDTTDAELKQRREVSSMLTETGTQVSNCTRTLIDQQCVSRVPQMAVSSTVHVLQSLETVWHQMRFPSH